MALRRKRTMRYRRLPVAIEHTGFYGYLVAYNDAMAVRGYSGRTLHRRESDLRRFVGWCDERGLSQPRDITKPILERYQKHLYTYRQANGEPLSAASQNHYLTSVRQLFKWLTRENHLLYNPASELVIIQNRATLPAVLSVEEVERLMQQPDLRTLPGLRDRALLECLYSTGVRRSELCALTLGDLSLARRTLLVRQGKGHKDRLLPVGERAGYWLARYLDTARPELVADVREQALFVNDYGEAFRDSKLGDKVKRYLKHAGIDAPGSCHLLRHACATHMLENGAELRYLQALLGHADPRATQLYTHVSIRKLAEIHALTHPAKLSGREPPAPALLDNEEPV